MAWIDVASLDALEVKGKLVVRHDGRQILLLATQDGIVACANRCPHEGYPLSEGTLAGCVLTCNWHNWQFDLASGETLVGGDLLPRYPVEVAGGRIRLDLTPPDPAARRQAILDSVRAALDDQDEQRLVRETARLMQLSADPLDAVRTAIDWAAERLEFGTTHAVAAASGWLTLWRQRPGTAEGLAALGEILGHLADDARSGRQFPFPAGASRWDEAAFLAAFERQDEAAALGLLRGALEAGLAPAAFQPTLIAAALTHYADFGHSLIYVEKSFELIEALGPGSAQPLLLLLGRSLIYATREDLIPEFRDYAAEYLAWGRGSGSAEPLDPAMLDRVTANQAMRVVAGWSEAHPPEAIFSALLAAAASSLLRADARLFARTDGKLAENVGWLDFTHALTFAEAGLASARRLPALWPAVLLQLACFIGRNSGYLDRDLDVARWAVADVERFVATETAALLDHGRDRFIISAHLQKTLLAGTALMRACPEHSALLAAALNRFLDAPIKGRHILRTARQMAALVEAE